MNVKTIQNYNIDYFWNSIDNQFNALCSSMHF